DDQQQEQKDSREIVQSIIGDDYYTVGTTKMIPLRKVTESLGYTVTWEQATKTATIRLENSSFLITVGEKTYGYNRSLQTFAVGTKLKGYSIFVYEDFIDMLRVR